MGLNIVSASFKKVEIKAGDEVIAQDEKLTVAKIWRGTLNGEKTVRTWVRMTNGYAYPFEDVIPANGGAVPPDSEVVA